jgi:hypothetical protein
MPKPIAPLEEPIAPLFVQDIVAVLLALLFLSPIAAMLWLTVIRPQ